MQCAGKSTGCTARTQEARTRLLRHAAVEAVRTGHERIDHAMLDRVRTESPAMIETLATSDRF